VAAPSTKQYPEGTLFGADGRAKPASPIGRSHQEMVRSSHNHFLDQHHPVCAITWGCALPRLRFAYLRLRATALALRVLEAARYRACASRKGGVCCRPHLL